jgi:hypothetical protein
VSRPERVSIIREKDDILADTRISLGSKEAIGLYMVFRGSPEEVIELLKKSLAVAQQALPAGAYEDHR